MADATDIHTQACECGLKVRFKTAHVGRTVTCTNCRRPITLRAPASPHAAMPDPLPAGYGLEDPEPPPPARGSRSVASRAPAVSDEDLRAEARRSREARRAEIQAERTSGGFWRHAGRCFSFLNDIESIVKTIGLALFLMAADFVAILGLFGLIAAMLMYGAVVNFYFNTIINSAGGDDSLPSSEDWDGFWESGFKPFFTIVLVSIALFAPGFAVGNITGDALLGALVLGLGAFLWPVSMLLAALGGPIEALRIDYGIRTIASAFPQYLLICALLVVAIAAQWIALGGGAGFLPPTILNVLETPFIGTLVLNINSVYFTLVSMKLIGLYYRHFSDRFPWDAG